jgi:hypothetical protein
MKKNFMKYLIVSLLFGLCQVSFGQAAQVVNPKAKAKVKQIKSMIYTDDVNGAVRLQQGDVYQPQYRLAIEVLRFNSLGKVIEKRTEDSTGKIIQQNLYEYDAKGNNIKSVEMVSGHKSLTTINTYRNDSLVQRQYFDGNDRLISTWVSEFDRSQRLQTTTEWIAGKKDNFYHTYYNKNGLQVKDSQFTREGQLYFYWEADYNGTRLTKKKSWARDSINYDCKEYRHDKKKRVVEIKEFDKENKLLRITSIDYDNKNNPVLITTSFPRSNERYSEKTQYTYDKFGNWESKKTFGEHSKVELTKTFRQIEYFE